MQIKFFLAASAASLSLACGLVSPAYAQETTSAVAGQVTDASGRPLSAAKVSVSHVPSGTVSTATTDSGGNFSLRGLRVGGPYSVTVDSGNYAPVTVDDVFLSVGETYALPVQLTTREIVVNAASLDRGRGVALGSQSTFGAVDIQNTVSARRDIRDIISKDPLASYNANVGGVSIAGGNIRTQRFSVDGVQLQDSFGLNYGGLPSSRGIVSIEAIDQITVKAAPFDISEGNFQGGAVNVVLKSGTNLFHGSALANFGGPKLTSKRTADNRDPLGVIFPVANTTVLDFRNYGGSLSGPIIKDTLFLALAYEQLTEGTTNPFGLQGSAAANIVPNAFAADQTAFRGINSVISAFPGLYGTFPIGTVPTVLAEKDKKYSAKLDWNVTDGQRLSASYIHHENTLPNFGSGGSTSITSPYIALQSDLYRLTEFTNAGSLQLNSQWSDQFSTELRASYKFYRRGQEAFFGSDFAQFNVCLDNASSPLGAAIVSAETLCNTGVPIVRLGPDTPRQANEFSNNILTFQGRATYQAGAHAIKLEYDNAYSKLYNLFVFGTSGLAGTGGPQGLYYFDSFADFSNKRANELVLNTTTTGNKRDGFVRWGYTTHTVGIQDTWTVDPTLTINAGLRYDLIRADKTIALNNNFLARFGNLYPGLTNVATTNGREKLQPRFGFNWKPTPTLRISGGFGLFEGGLSDVFISNNYSNTGGILNSSGASITGIDLVRINGGCIDRSTGNSTANGTLAQAVCAALDNVNGATPNAAALAYLQTNTGVLANATTNSLDPRFQLPAQWKYNLSVAWRPEFGQGWLGQGWTVRGDALFSDAQAALRWIDLRAQPLVIGGVTQISPDGRTRYGGVLNSTTGPRQPGGNSDIQLTNTKQGLARVFALSVQKKSDFVDMSASYTHQTVKDVAGTLVSSSVGSSYGVPTDDPNSGGAYGRSTFEVRNAYRLEVDFHHKFVGDNETRLGIYFSSRSGTPYSATMFDNTNNSTSGRASVFGTINTSSHLFYVPDFTQAAISGVTYYVNGGATPIAGGVQVGNVIFDSQATYAAVQGLVNGTSLKQYQGKIVPKNSLFSPRYNKLDLNFAQQVPLPFGSKVTALFSIENFLNLLNRDWGSYQEYGNTSLVRVSCARTTVLVGPQACSNYVYSVFNDPKTTTYSKASLWTIRVGARVSF